MNRARVFLVPKNWPDFVCTSINKHEMKAHDIGVLLASKKTKHKRDSWLEASMCNVYEPSF
jgi:hypothetical protein